MTPMARKKVSKLAKFLKKEKEARALSLEQLGKLCGGLSGPYMHMLINGTRKTITVDTAAKIAQGTGRPLEEISRIAQTGSA